MALGQFSPADLAIDMGTNRTRIYVRGKGIVINEASAVAMDSGKNGRIVAIGDSAEEVAGRSDNRIRILHPVQQGKITDLETAQLMIQYFVNKAIGTVRLKPRAIAVKPIGCTRMEESILKRTVETIGCRAMVITDSIIASGIGAGLSVYEPQGSFIVDIGAGKTEIALTSMGGIVISHSVPVGGNQIDREIVEHIRREYEMSIVEHTAEQIKFDLTDISRPDTSDRYIVVRGRDIATGMPTTAEIRIEGIRAAVCTVLDQILEAVKWVLTRVPPEMCVDVLKNGIMVCGGSSLLPKLADKITDAFGVPSLIAREAGECAVLGAGYMADHFEVYSSSVENKKL
ncbi:MAG: rod shape-determining protein [Clostridia bacterium]|nr:rod shape-determining protein [Clostridia bacterium]